MKAIEERYPDDICAVFYTEPGYELSPNGNPEYRFGFKTYGEATERHGIRETPVLLDDWDELPKLLEHFPDPWEPGNFDVVDEAAANAGDRYKLGCFWRLFHERFWFIRGMEIYQEFVETVKPYEVEQICMAFLLLVYAVKSSADRTIAETVSICQDFDKFARRLQTIETINGVHEMFRELFDEIVSKQHVYSRKRYEVLINQVKDYVGENYQRSDLSINQISDHVNMSAAYLGRLFKQVAGITFTEYLTPFRLDNACRLLREGSMTVNDISDAVGFTNSSYFYIIFKKNLGCTPSQYRKQYDDAAETDIT